MKSLFSALLNLLLFLIFKSHKSPLGLTVSAFQYIQNLNTLFDSTNYKSIIKAAACANTIMLTYSDGQY